MGRPFKSNPKALMSTDARMSSNSPIQLLKGSCGKSLRNRRATSGVSPHFRRTDLIKFVPASEGALHDSGLCPSQCVVTLWCRSEQIGKQCARIVSIDGERLI